MDTPEMLESGVLRQVSSSKGVAESERSVSQ